MKNLRLRLPVASRSPRLRPRPLALALAGASMLSLLPGLDDACAQSLPTGATLVHGQAGIVTQGSQMTVTSTNNAVLNWQTFSIGQGHTVRFDQPSATSQVLNRVVGTDPSGIFGNLTSNGRVWLLNPNGVLFGQTARIDVAGLVASSLNISNSDWLTGRYSFADAQRDDRGVVNQGELRTTLGGRIALVAGPGGVRNEGVIDASGGQVVLAAGQGIELVDTGAPNLTLRVEAPKGEALNLGTVSAAGGRIDVQAAIVNQRGIARAESVERGPGGTIVLKASQNLDLAAGSVTSARGGSGGEITLDAGKDGRTLVSGEVSAQGDAGRGGSVQVLGRQVGVLDGARVDASGEQGGGRILVGGGAEGKDPSVANSEAAYIGPRASLWADAVLRGDGGNIVVWSDTATRAYGNFSARGGRLGGDGGLIETSGGWLDARPSSITASAENGKAGRWLLDPYNIQIVPATSGGVPPPPGPFNFTSSSNDSTIEDYLIRSVLEGGNNVTISTGPGGAQAGNIQMTSADITYLAGPSSNVTLTLNAHNEIRIVNSSIGVLDGGGILNVNLNTGNRSVLTGNESVSLVSSGIGRAGSVQINSPNVSLVDSGITASSIIVKGVGATQHAQTFHADASSGFNVSPNGRWLVYVNTRDDRFFSAFPISSFDEFIAVGYQLGSPPNPSVMPETGNGFVFRDPLSIRSTGPSLTKIYDGTTSFQLPDPSAYSFLSAVASDRVVVNVVGPSTLHRADGPSGDASPAPQSALGGASYSVFNSDFRTIRGVLQFTGDFVDVVVLPRPLTLTAISAQNKVYDGTLAASLNVGSLQNLVGSQTFANVVSGSFLDRNAGTGKPVALTYALSGGSNGALASNYTISGPTITRADITPAPVVLSGFGATKVYDGNTAATLTGGTISGLVPGESFATVGTGTFDTKDVGNDKAVRPNYVLGGGTGGALAGNYMLAASQPSVVGSITPRPLAIQGATAANKVYDGNTDATVSAVTLAGLVDGESFALTTRGVFDTKDAGLGKTVSLVTTLGAGSGGASAGNYLAPGPGSTTADITPRPLNLVGVSAQNKVYDGSTAATLGGGTLSGLVGNESFATTLVGSFDSKDVGNGKSVAVGYVLGNGSNGALASNYESAGTTTTVASITPKSLTWASVTAADKVYDGGIVASVSGGGLLGLVGNESFATVVRGTFANKNVGSGKAVTVTTEVGAGSNGALASNYSMPAATPATITASITPRTVNLSGFTAADKVYDTTTTASVGNWILAGVLQGETVTAAGGQGRFADADAGQAKLVTGQVSGLAGVDASNYSLGNANANSTANITPATLTYVANPAQRFVGAPLTGFSGRVTGFVGSDTQAASTTGTASFTTPATAASRAGTYAIDGGGLAARNYRFVQAEGNATALTLDPLVLTESPADETRSIVDAAARSLNLAMAPANNSSTNRALDGLQVLQFGADAGASGASFKPLPLQSMTQDELGLALATRERFKENLFAVSVAKLSSDPALADVGACQTVAQIDSGTCLVTDALRAEAAARRPAVTAQAAIAPAATEPARPAPVPSAATAPAGARKVAKAPLTAPDFRTRTRTAVKPALPQIERKIAVLIGVDVYDDARIPKLENAIGDARAMAQVLESTLGYEAVVLENPSKESVIATLNRLALDAGPNDSVVIYYAGHGELVPATGLGYWQLANAEADKPETWISNADIGRLLSQVGASQVALISDSCYSGALVASERLRASGAELNPQDVLARKSVVVMSSGGKEPVADQGRNGHSPFAYNLMQQMQRVSNWQAGGNVFERVRFAVARELPQRPQYGPSAQGGHQAGGDYLFEQRQLTGR